MLLGTVLLVGALSFMPAVVLGPVADHLIGHRGLSRRSVACIARKSISRTQSFTGTKLHEP